MAKNNLSVFVALDRSGSMSGEPWMNATDLSSATAAYAMTGAAIDMSIDNNMNKQSS